MDDPSGGVNHFLRICQNKGYVYDTMWLPHDAKAKRLGTKRSIEEMVRSAGYNVRIVPNLSRTDGINAARIIFPNCWFDENECADGIQALSHYRYNVVNVAGQTKGQYSNEPVHDWASDAADAFRYMAIAFQERKAKIDVGARLAAAAASVIGSRKDQYAESGRASRSGRLGWMR
jgi:phage terminase large subunit